MPWLMIETFFYQPINNNFKTYKNIRKIETGKEDNYPSGCLLNSPYFKGNYKIIAIKLSKQETLDADPRAIQQVNVTANLDRTTITTMSFIFEEAKETVFDFSQGIIKVL